MNAPTYDVRLSYDENYAKGPFFFEAIPPRRPGRRTKFLGREVNSLLGIPAGPLLNSRWIELYAKLGFDLPIYKTVRSRAYPSHPPPNCMFLKISHQLSEEDFDRPLIATEQRPKEEISITNSFGMPSRPPQIWQEDAQRAKRALGEGQLLILSVVGTPDPGSADPEGALAEDYARAAKMALEAGADAVEINLSCPNVVTREGAVFCDPELSSRISRRAKKEIGSTPLIIKMGYVADPGRLASVLAANAPYVDAVSGVNTLPFEVLREDGSPALPGPGRRRAGVCGAAIRSCAMRQTARCVEAKQKEKYDFAVIGVGGVMTVEDIKGYFGIGADAVMSATGAMWDPYLAVKYHERS